MLTSLDLSENRLNVEGGKAIAEALKVNGAMADLNLSYNYMGAGGAKAIAEMLTINSTLTSLDLASEPFPLGGDIGAEGVEAIAEALKGNGVLNNIDLRFNALGDEGKGAIRDAVSGREGFKLQM